jgi:hypothetical protein
MDLGGNDHHKRNKSPKTNKQIQEPIWYNPYLHYDDQNIKTCLKKKDKKKKSTTSLKKETESEASIPEARGLVGRSKRYA